MKAAMKSGNKDELSFARNLHAAVRKKEIDDRIDIDDAGIQKIVQTLIKQRNDSIDGFKQGGRMDLVAKEELELAFLRGYMPEQMSEADVKRAVVEAIAETKATSPKDMGMVMKALMPKTQGKADGKLVSQWVKDLLAEKKP